MFGISASDFVMGLKMFLPRFQQSTALSPGLHVLSNHAFWHIYWVILQTLSVHRTCQHLQSIWRVGPSPTLSQLFLLYSRQMLQTVANRIPFLV